MTRKLISLVTLLMLFLLSFTLVSAQDDGTTIGVLIPNTENDFSLGVSEGVQSAAESLGVSVTILESDGDIETEMANLQTLINQGVNALLITPTDAVESLATIAAANEAGIPVFIMGDTFEVSEAEDVSIVSTIGMDNVLAGQTAAESLCGLLESTGTILEIVNLPDVAMEEDVTTLSEQRSEGFNIYMTESCADVTVMTVDISGMDMRDSVSTLISTLGNNEINGIFAYNDTDALLAMQATIRARLVGVSIVGFNATTDTLGVVQMGRVTGIISPSGSDLGQTAVETVVSYLAGEEVNTSILTDPFYINADLMTTVRVCEGRCDDD